jgi:eukaryotic-like serine/threonine-protein kinase
LLLGLYLNVCHDPIDFKCVLKTVSCQFSVHIASRMTTASECRLCWAQRTPEWVNSSHHRNFTYGYSNIAAANLYLDRLPEAEKAIQNSIEHKHQPPDLVLLQYHVACLKGDRAGMDRAAASAVGKPGIEDWMLHAQSLVEARLGRLQAAETLSRRAQDLARQAGQKESAASYETAEAVWAALYGNAMAARHSATAALELSHGRDVEYSAAFAFALAGDWPHSQSLATDLEKRFPEDTSVQSNYLPSLHALFALNGHDPRKAIEQLQPAIRYELAVPAIDFNEFFGGLYPVCARQGISSRKASCRSRC